MQKLFDERLARYQATIALEPTDRMVVGGTGSNYFAETYAGYNLQGLGDLERSTRNGLRREN